MNGFYAIKRIGKIFPIFAFISVLVSGCSFRVPFPELQQKTRVGVRSLETLYYHSAAYWVQGQSIGIIQKSQGASAIRSAETPLAVTTPPFVSVIASREIEKAACSVQREISKRIYMHYAEDNPLYSPNIHQNAVNMLKNAISEEFGFLAHQDSDVMIHVSAIGYLVGSPEKSIFVLHLRAHADYREGRKTIRDLHDFTWEKDVYNVYVYFHSLSYSLDEWAEDSWNKIDTITRRSAREAVDIFMAHFQNSFSKYREHLNDRQITRKCYPDSKTCYIKTMPKSGEDVWIPKGLERDL